MFERQAKPRGRSLRVSCRPKSSTWKTPKFVFFPSCLNTFLTLIRYDSNTRLGPLHLNAYRHDSPRVQAKTGAMFAGIRRRLACKVSCPYRTAYHMSMLISFYCSSLLWKCMPTAISNTQGGCNTSGQSPTTCLRASTASPMRSSSFRYIACPHPSTVKSAQLNIRGRE